jgi:hypothetical protein
LVRTQSCRVLFGDLSLGELVAKPKRRQLRLSPVDSVSPTQPAVVTVQPPPNRHHVFGYAPFLKTTVTHVLR